MIFQLLISGNLMNFRIVILSNLMKFQLLLAHINKISLSKTNQKSHIKV